MSLLYSPRRPPILFLLILTMAQWHEPGTIPRTHLKIQAVTLNGNQVVGVGFVAPAVTDCRTGLKYENRAFDLNVVRTRVAAVGFVQMAGENQRAATAIERLQQ